ncbi:transcription termination factor Rho [Bifidobacterium sp.]|uniref:transcription termination factor Rho n=1 Tax=Bifidobacterium sp. TaxID=41200 RepID=UPI0025C2F69C|nr:transcription termination factor Rho [Bifidobacterium sp.]MCI1635058.1 transcription termination factor Rho [Bifidobacterium sp.]
MATSQKLTDMKLPELKELAKQLGLRGTSTMRKPALVATIEAARSGGEAPAGVTVRSSVNSNSQNPADSETTQQHSVSNDVQESAPASSIGKQSRSRRDNRNKTVVEEVHTQDAQAARGASVQGLFDDASSDKPKSKRSSSDQEQAPSSHKDEEILTLPRRRRNRTQSAHTENAEHSPVRDLDDILAVLPNRNERNQQHTADTEAPVEEHETVRRGRRDRSDRNERGNNRNNRNERSSERNNDRNNDRNERNSERRNRNRRDRSADYENREDDRRDETQQEELVPVAGIVDVLDSYAFIRTSGYLPGPNDVYVSMGQVRKYALRKGDAVHGAIRPPREGDRRNQRQKFVPLQSIDSVNGMSIEDASNRSHFNKLTPLYPQERLRMETQPNKLTGRLIDIISPIGKGQRGLIVSPPKAGKTITLQNIANSISTNNPEVHLMVVLVDERPEEVTDMERTVQGEVISSTFDRPASDHTTVAELAIERAKRLVELGQDVVVLLDSMTRLARAYNIAAPASGRILSGGVDAQALYPPKKFFGAARNIENGGSLTIISSALVETGSKMDEVIFEEFKGTGNMELRLSRELADKRLFPAIDIISSGTRREELITPPEELAVIYRLRRAFGGMEPEQAYQTLVPRLKKTPSNRDFLAAITSSMPQVK